MIMWHMQLVIVRSFTLYGVKLTLFNGSIDVRQGGVLSLKLLAIYIDDLSLELVVALCKSNCYIDKQCMNHNYYIR